MSLFLSKTSKKFLDQERMIRATLYKIINIWFQLITNVDRVWKCQILFALIFALLWFFFE